MANFKTPAAAFDADFLYAVVVSTGGRTDRDGEVVAYFKTEQEAEQEAFEGEYSVLKTEYMD